MFIKLSLVTSVAFISLSDMLTQKKYLDILDFSENTDIISSLETDKRTLNAASSVLTSFLKWDTSKKTQHGNRNISDQRGSCIPSCAAVDGTDLHFWSERQIYTGRPQGKYR